MQLQRLHEPGLYVKAEADLGICYENMLLCYDIRKNATNYIDYATPGCYNIGV